MKLYEKHPLAIKAQKELQKIDSSLEIGELGYCDDKLSNVGLSFPEKGNQELIKKLQRLGYEKAKRQNRS